MKIQNPNHCRPDEEEREEDLMVDHRLGKKGFLDSFSNGCKRKGKMHIYPENTKKMFKFVSGIC
jgi:hypothetical protein